MKRANHIRPRAPQDAGGLIGTNSICRGDQRSVAAALPVSLARYTKAFAYADVSDDGRPF